MNADAVVERILPRSLITSVKWHSEFIDDNAPISIANHRHEETYGDEERIIESAEIYRVPAMATPIPTVHHVDVSVGSAHTTEEEHEIIRRIEHQQPPPMIVHRKLANNLVTYQQNISVRYLRPPTPPAPGPLIIRNGFLCSCSSL